MSPRFAANGSDCAIELRGRHGGTYFDCGRGRSLAAIDSSASPLLATGAPRKPAAAADGGGACTRPPAVIERPLPHGCANDVAPGTVPKSHYSNGGSAAISTGWPPPMQWWRGYCCNLLAELVGGIT
jgi:hypothetical protein